MRTIYFVFIVFLFAALFHFACKDDVIPPKTDDDPGILRTDEFGNILGGDSTDWCWRGASNGFSFGPARPNPATGITCSIDFLLPAPDKVKVYLLRSPTDTVFFINDSLPAGGHGIGMNITPYVNTYQRIYIQCNSFISSDSCKNYGDIKFEE